MLQTEGEFLLIASLPLMRLPTSTPSICVAFPSSVELESNRLKLANRNSCWFFFLRDDSGSNQNVAITHCISFNILRTCIIRTDF